MIGRDGVENAAFARVGRIEGAFVKFHAFAQALDHPEAVVVHGRFHHLHDMAGIGVRGPGDKRGACGNQLFHWINRMIDSAPDIRFALETHRRSRRGLFLG